MFRGDASLRYVMWDLRAAIPSREMEISNGDRVISSPVFKDNVIYFAETTEMCTRLTRDRSSNWKRATNGPVLLRRPLRTARFTSAVTTEKFYAFDARPAR